MNIRIVSEPTGVTIYDLENGEDVTMYVVLHILQEGLVRGAIEFDEMEPFQADPLPREERARRGCCDLKFWSSRHNWRHGHSFSGLVEDVADLLQRGLDGEDLSEEGLRRLEDSDPFAGPEVGDEF